MSRRTKAQIEQDNLEKSKRRQFTDWLYKQYDISFLPVSFFVNLDKVYKGTYKNLKRPVPVEDLWDMWQKKMPYLLKVHEKNNRQGKTMEGMQYILYDLSIILSKYDSYLKWKETQKQAIVNDNLQKMRIEYNNLNNDSSNSNNSKNTAVDINSILDDI